MDGSRELNKVQAIYEPRKPPVEGEAEPPRKWSRPAGLPSFGIGPPLLRVDSSHLLEFMSFTIAPLWTSLSWRYLRGKDGIGNPSLNLHLLCLIPKYLDLIFVGLVLWALLARLKYPFYPLFILDNGMNLISKSLTIITPA